MIFYFISQHYNAAQFFQRSEDQTSRDPAFIEVERLYVARFFVSCYNFGNERTVVRSSCAGTVEMPGADEKSELAEPWSHGRLCVEPAPAGLRQSHRRGIQSNDRKGSGSQGRNRGGSESDSDECRRDGDSSKQ